MKTKTGADIRFLRQEIVPYLPNIEWIVLHHAKVIPGFEFVITSGNDSRHGPNSLHPKNRAIDIRTKYQRTRLNAKVRAFIDFLVDWYRD